MAEIAGSFVGPALEVVKWVSAPILRQFNYLCCFSANITSLKNEAEKLQDTDGDLQLKVHAAENDVQIISGKVEAWLRDSKNIKDETDGILNEVPNVEGGCFKLRARFSLSRRAKKTTDRLKELRDQCKFDADAISRPRPPASTEAVPSERTYEFESRKKIEEDIMAALRGEDVKMVGICGMGGLGKTTMAKRIWNRVLEEHVFEEVVMAVVSQPTDKLKIQLEIGGSLGLKLEGETWQTRVQKLHARLSGPKRILLVLDDVWERLQPEDLGIPCGHKGCTILLTSRNRDVLNAMKVQKVFGMTVLSEEDSWFLFRETVGTCVDHTKLNSISKKVVNECKGLPIALIAVGAVLQDEVNVCIWEDALRQLNQSDPDIPELISNVYNPLKLSYDVLGSKHKSVFLLCCLFPEDADIPLERLTYFCMGLGIFEGGIRNVEEARNRMLALIKMLKSRCLLLDSNKGNQYVRMHDVVRDVCIFIAKQEKYIGDHDHCTWISSTDRSELPMGLAVPNLRLLFFQAHKYLEGEFTLDNSFLQRTRDLSMICIERYSLVSLPHTTPKLINLNTLVLDRCKRVETLSVVGELVNLEILICRRCESLEELPPEIKGLDRLKVLDLTGCRNLQRIGRGIVSNLVGLEELKMLESFKKWEGEDRKQRENAGLKELGQLPNLRCLEIEIEDLALAAENIRLSSEVDRFTIRFSYQTRLISKFGEYLSNKKMILNLEGASCLGDWIKMLLLRDTECLLLVGNGANEVGSLRNLEKIRYLELGECESMKKVVTSSMDKGGATVFPSLENLLLFKLPKLEEIWDDRISSNSFQNLKILTLVDLPVLKQLWKSSPNDLGKDFLPQLEGLEIWNCGMMETVFLWKGEDGNENTSCHHITKIFPKLKELGLEDLPNLISLCQGIEGTEFPLLRRMEIKGCRKMKGMTANGVTNNENNSGGTHHIFCESRVPFGCLKQLNTDRNPFCCHTIRVSLLNGLEELKISNCAGSRSLFTSSMAGNLLNLKELLIRGCEEMVEVMKDSEEKGMRGGRQRALLFPKLEMIVLWHLPNLLSFCEWKCDVEFPSLRKVDIHNCPNMKNFTLGSLAAPNLECFKTDLKDYLLQVLPFNIVKELSVSQIHGSVFDRLEELQIRWYEGSMSLFSSSITGNLVNLTRLDIRYCDKMVKVIEEKEEEKEKVVSGAQRTTILFPKLQNLVLWDLPSLVRFCEWKCDVELPSLRRVVIFNCHNMKSFTLGPLNTPKLESVRMDGEEFGGVKDLNDILQQQYINRTEVRTTNKQIYKQTLNTPKLESINRKDVGGVNDLNGLVQQQYINRTEEKQAEEAEKKKGGEEEHERKGETEEEQN